MLCATKKPAQVGNRVPPSGPGQAEEPQWSSQEQAQGQPSMRGTHYSASHFWWYLQRTCPHYCIRIRSLQSKTGWELQWYFRPPLLKHTPALLKRSAVLYGKKCVKLGPKVSPECTQFGCLNLLIIVTITQIVIWECLLTIRQNCRQTSQAWSWREEFKWDINYFTEKFTLEAWQYFTELNLSLLLQTTAGYSAFGHGME